MAKKQPNQKPEEKPNNANQNEWKQQEQNLPVQQGQQPGETDKDARMWAMFCHLAGLALFLQIPLANIIGPLIVWQIKKDESAFIDEQGKEAVNFQISMTIYTIISIILIFACIGIVLLPLVIILDVVFLLIAAVKSNDGFHYRYPLSIRFIR